MTDWLKEIEKEAHLFMEKDVQRMARVLRELAQYILSVESIKTKDAIEFSRKVLSEDAKELCVAARERARE